MNKPGKRSREYEDEDYEDEDNTSTMAGTLNRKRVRWTPELQETFICAVNKLGLFNGAVPSAILKEMGGTSATGLTRENVASHLQLYRAQMVKDVINSMGPGGVQRDASTHCRRELLAYQAQNPPQHPDEWNWPNRCVVPVSQCQHPCHQTDDGHFE